MNNRKYSVASRLNFSYHRYHNALLIS